MPEHVNEKSVFFVKNCEKRFNTKQCGTVNIGTLELYRETGEEQIADVEEGFFSLSVDFNDIDVQKKLAHYLTNRHLGVASLNIEAIGGKSKSLISEEMDHFSVYKVHFKWVYHNRFVFSISCFNDPTEASGLFPKYDDLWFIRKENMNKALEIIRDETINHVCDLLRKGKNPFKSHVTIDPIETNCTLKGIDYRQRKIIYNNAEYERDPDFIHSIHERIPFIKPSTYSNEKEYRFIIDFFQNGVFLEPKEKFLIISTPSLTGLIETL
ncbi:TPA: hypothetical protein ACTYUA_000905 [Enterobacter hormaechei]